MKSERTEGRDQKSESGRRIDALVEILQRQKSPKLDANRRIRCAVTVKVNAKVKYEKGMRTI